MNIKLFSFDAETPHLWGGAFSIGAVVTENGITVAKFVGTCPIEGQVDPWVAENVLPFCDDPDYPDFDSLLRAFAQFYHQHKKGAIFIAHVGCPVEAYLLRCMYERGLFESAFDAPFPLHEVSTMLLSSNIMRGTSFDTLSVDKTVTEIWDDLPENVKNAYQDATKPIQGKTHNPLWDSYQAGLVAYYLMQS